MAFEIFLNKPASEMELMDWVSHKLQTEFFELRDTYYFLKLSKCERGISQIVWEKSYSNLQDLSDFIWDTEKWRASILIRFEGDHFVSACFGFSICQIVNIWIDRIKKMPAFECSGNIEERPMPSPDLLSGFDDIAMELKEARKVKAV